MVEITCVVDAKAELGEGTLWDPKEGVLWWIDIWQKHIHRYDPATGKNRTYEAPEYLGCLGLREKGGLVLTMVSTRPPLARRPMQPRNSGACQVSSAPVAGL